jgi:lysine 2,3-aminomutase
MALSFRSSRIPEGISKDNWFDWKWQQRNSLKTATDFATEFNLSEAEQLGFENLKSVFKSQTTRYYAGLADRKNPLDPIRRIFMPNKDEEVSHHQQMPDPLGEMDHSPAPRIVHRYPDRLLFLPTDLCSVYCRYCTRKHFTAKDQAFVQKSDYEQAIDYIRSATGVREVILSGGDPLTISDAQLERVLNDLRSIDHIEIIRIGTRMPVVNPMRVTKSLVDVMKPHQPIFVMVHFNHPDEITEEAAAALSLLVDNGVPVFNQMVLLNGVNNHPALIQALSRRLLYLRVKPYYMFQCDPSEGTDHLRTSLTESLAIQKELWGRLSGLAMPNLSLDIPNGGGKVGFAPDFEVDRDGERSVTFCGWDGKQEQYINPPLETLKTPEIPHIYRQEWQNLKTQPTGKKIPLYF